MATAKNINRSTDPNVRKSPPLSANAFPVDHVAKGNDGNYWTITEDGNGIKRWVKVNKTASKSSSTKSSTSQTALSTPAVETQQEALDRYNEILNITSTIQVYYTLSKTNIVVYIEDKLNIPKYQILIGNNIVVDENDLDFKEKLQDYLAQRFVITNVKIEKPRADITGMIFEFDPNADPLEKKDALNLLDDFLYDQMNVRNGKQLPAPVQSSSTSSTNELKKFEDSLSSSGAYYLTMPKSGVKIYEFNTPDKNYQFYIQLDKSQENFVVERYLREKIKDFESVKEVTIAILRTGNLLHVIIEFDNSISNSTRLIEISILDNYLFGTLGIKPSTTSTEAAVQEAETKVDDIVFSAPVVPVGTEDQRNATDKLVDEFIAKNENNLKKLAVENVGLLSTIDKTLEFIKAKFGTPAAVTSVSNLVSTSPQPAYPDNIDDYKLIQFIGDNGERQVIEFKKFKTGKNANVFKYFIGDVFLDTNSSNADANFVYKQIIGAQEGGVYAGYIHYIDSYPGKIGVGLTWDSRVKKISVGDFEGKIESGEWTSIPGANQNLNKISSAVSNASTNANRPFKLGDKVKIKKSSKYYVDGDDSNPKDREGVIKKIEVSRSNPIHVEWDNDYTNSYEKEDLELVSNAKTSFELGDVVKIKSDSQYFGKNLSNPSNMQGVIVDIDTNSKYPIKVVWGNGKDNTYPIDDLEFFSQSTTLIPTKAPTQLSKKAPVTSGGSSVAGIGDTVTFYASREKANLTGIVKAIVTGTDGKPYLRINVNGKFYLKQQGSVKKV
jgi:hypothetical protein